MPQHNGCKEKSCKSTQDTDEQSTSKDHKPVTHTPVISKVDITPITDKPAEVKCLCKEDCKENCVLDKNETPLVEKTVQYRRGSGPDNKCRKRQLTF